MERYIVPAFLLVSLFVIIAAFAVIVGLARSPRTFAVAGLEASQLPGLSGGARSRESFLSRVAAKTDRERMRQVYFIASLIRGSRERRDAVELARSIVYESLREGVDPLFVAAVIKAESTFNTHARSPVGALGLMQIMPATGKFVADLHQELTWHGTFKLHDVRYNLRLGIAYLKHLEKEFLGNTEHVLVAYNWGPANMRRALNGTSRAPRSSLRYARQIISDHGVWQKRFTSTYSVASSETRPTDALT